MGTYNRSLDELKINAALHWSKDMLEKAESYSVLPLLLQTQDEFIYVLKLASKSPTSWFEILNQSKTLTHQLFLKHLMVLTDLGGESLNKLPPLSNYFNGNKISFNWNDDLFEYNFKEIHNKVPLTNASLKVDARSMYKEKTFTNRMYDTVMLLLFGALDEKNELPSDAQSKCNIGLYIGKKEDISKIIKENYIKVSKQISGERANSLGHASQNYVANILKDNLGERWDINQEGHLSNITHTGQDGNETTFDIVVLSPTKKEFGVEISFQVTTNSTIERKAREAKSIFEKTHNKNHKICYVIDGAGNINIRKTAIKTICEYSDCTVAMSENEIKHLANYMLAIEKI